jgi:hypothetical protein
MVLQFVGEYVVAFLLKTLSNPDRVFVLLIFRKIKVKLAEQEKLIPKLRDACADATVPSFGSM